MGTRIDQATRGRDLHARARAFGLAGETVDGLDVRAVRSAAGPLIDAARGGRPGFLAVECYRFFGHARMDKSPYRSAEEEAQGRARDPLGFARAVLLEQGAEGLDALDAEIAAEMDAAIEFSIAAPAPALSSMFRDVYALGEAEPEPVTARIDRILAKD
jgi:pyruvate dehydrogenase E1 component alpha subunit